MSGDEKTMNESEGEKFDGEVKIFPPPNYSTRDYLIPQNKICNILGEIIVTPSKH